MPPSSVGDLQRPDITINTAADALLEIEARNIPLGTRVKLNMYSENGSTMGIESTPLAGTPEQSSATASMKVPAGVSRFFVQALWTP